MSVHESATPQVASTGFAVLRARTGTDPRFLYRVVQSNPFVEEVVARSTGVSYPAINPSTLANIEVPLPDHNTQKAIAGFLDRETARIDQLIEKKQRLVELADEKAAALITAAVAGQIGPGAFFKHPASEVCGDTIRLRHLVTIGPSVKEARHIGHDDKVTFAPMDAVRDGIGGLDTSASKTFGELSSGSYNFFVNEDILLAKLTPCFENGKKAIATNLVNGIGFATSEVHILRPDKRKINLFFLLYVFCSEDFRAFGMRSMTGSGGLRRVSENGVLDYRIQAFDLDIQKAIADFIHEETNRFDDLRFKTSESLSRLREFRSALITAAVTGQIDVTTWGKQGQTDRRLDQIEAEMRP